ncbi:heme A synthase [Gryllotalpicola reticulitermitis]|uniref:Heme A synthase n=1 Tax=Gryllotalpicola reticulitermitis TaxID=1184153 RepID=A0ABV8QCG7_9MICO
MKTPLGWAADRWTLSPRVLRWATTFALVMGVLIVLGGGIVRVTGSGLGCPTWPECEAGSLTTTPQLGIHGLIEYSNRMITGLLEVAVACVIIAARLQKPRVRSITRLAWSQFWLVVANAIVGGLSVLAKLNPYIVAFHFIMAMALLTTIALTWHRVHEQHGRPREVRPAARSLSWLTLAVTFLLICTGTVATGSGPHSGQAEDGTPVQRMAVDWLAATWVHGLLAGATLVLGVLLLVILRTPGEKLARERAGFFLAAVLVQGAIGVIQAVTGLPDVFVILHVVGASLVWVGAVRLVLDVQPGLFPSVQLTQAPAQSPRARATLR